MVRGRADLPRVLFFSVRVLRNPRLMERGLFALSDWPLPYPLPPDLLPYWSIGEAEDIVAECADEARLEQMSKRGRFI
jgi:hypothetical protein